MKRAVIAGGAFVLVFILLAVGYRAFRQTAQPAAAKSPADKPSAPSPAETHPAAENPQGYLYGRITTVDGAKFEGRLRWGRGDQEAFWGDYFNGFKHENRWLAQVPPERLPKEGSPIVEILGVKLGHKESPSKVGRQLMTPFGEIARIEAQGKEVRVTLKSGTVFDLDRFEASDFDDGVRVWDGKRGAVDLDSVRIRKIELLPGPASGEAPYRPYGTVRTRQGEFTGFFGWNRDESVGSDQLEGYAGGREIRLRFDTLRSIVKNSQDSPRVTRLDGREIVLSDTDDVGADNRGIYVDDPRYGRVQFSWDAFERVDLSPGPSGGSGPGYRDFPPGRPLAGTVTTRDGRRLTGRLIYDLDESETTDTFDAQDRSLGYTIPFGLIASLVAPGSEQRARVTLRNGQELQLAPEGDLGKGNAGLLVFVEGRQRPEYVPWTGVQRIDFER